MDKILKSSIPYRGPSTENLVEFIKDGLRKNGDQTLLIDNFNDVRWTGKQLEFAISRLAKHLVEDCGVEKGDICTLFVKMDSSEAAIVMLTIISIGATACLVQWGRSAREVYHVALSTGSKFIINSREMMEILDPEFTKDSSIKFITVGGVLKENEEVGSIFYKQARGIDLDDLVKNTKVRPDDYAVIQFSSGTTGKPKPIPRSHKNLCHLVASVDHDELVALKPGVITTGNYSLYVRPGTWALLACIKSGATFVIQSGCIDKIFSVVEKYKVTLLALSIPALIKLTNQDLAYKDKYDLSSLEHVTTSGAKILDTQIPERFVRELNLKSFRQCFGMTESGWVFIIEQSQGLGKYDTVGRIVPGMEVTVLNHETGQMMDIGNSGEIALRGPQIFPGYLTSEPGVLNRSDFTDDGWFKIGDEGYCDSNGLFYIVGRYKELLILKNTFRFYPDQIEAVLCQCEEVGGACVVKIEKPGEKLWFDFACAYVILKPGSKANELDIMNFLKQKNPDMQLEGGVKIVDDFPRTSTGKINKQALKNMN